MTEIELKFMQVVPSTLKCIEEQQKRIAGQQFKKAIEEETGKATE